MPLTSLQSYQLYRLTAWNYLELHAFDIEPYCCFFSNRVLVNDPTNVLAGLYGEYSAFNPNNAVAKQPLVGNALRQAVATFLQNTNNLTVVWQHGNNWPDITAQVGNLIIAYNGVNALNANQTRIMRSYLHVYPPAAAATANWRVGINVLPVDVAPAMAALEPILSDNAYSPAVAGNNNLQMGHLKAMMPGNANKPDTFVIYVRRPMQNNQFIDGGYLNFRNRVWLALQNANINLQARLGPMWNEIQDGFGEGAEPPRRGSSFGNYRVILTYLAYAALVNASFTRHTRDNFYELLDETFTYYGVPANQPDLQGTIGGLQRNDQISFARLLAYRKNNDGDQLVQQINQQLNVGNNNLYNQKRLTDR